MTEPQATDGGQGWGDHVARGQGTLPPGALSHMQCLAWDPVNRRSAKPRPFPHQSPRLGVPLSPPQLLAGVPVPLCSVTDPVFLSFFFFFKGKLFKKATFIIVSTGYYSSPLPPPARQPPKCLRTPLLRGGGRGAQGRVASLTPRCHGVRRPSRELERPGQGPHPPPHPTPAERFPEGTDLSPTRAPPPYTPSQ